MQCDYVKRTIFILFILLAGALLYADVTWISVSLNAQAKGRRTTPPAQPTRIDYSKFKHSSHAGEIKASRKGTVERLDCAYCHGRLTKDNPDVLRGYPYRKYGLKGELTHSACSDCHAITGRDSIVTGTNPTMCLICHQNPTLTRM